MGFENREYAYQSQPGFHLQAPQSVTIKLVLFTVGVYVLQLVVQPFTSWFTLSSNWFEQPWRFYTLLSYGFLHDTRGIEHILFNMFMLWMFGRELEALYGKREFLLFYLWAIVFAGLFWSVSEFSMGRPAAMLGASGGICGLFVLFALHDPHRQVLLMFLIPMPMWVVALLMIGYDVYGAISRTGNIAFTAHLAGAVAGLYFYKFGFSPFAWIADRFSGSGRKRKPKLKIHSPTVNEVDETDDVDDQREQEILAKIREHGQDSLTRSERRFMEKLSERYRRKRS